MNFDLQAVLDATNNTNLCGPKSTHMCARSVRKFLEYGGIDTSKRPGLARQYMTYLPTIGFSLVDTLSGGNDVTDEYTENSAKPGDIAVYYKPGDPNAAGHICLWNGKNWCSDFRQNHMNVYSGRSLDVGIYRWTGKIDYSAISIKPSPSFTSGGNRGNAGSGSGSGGASSAYGTPNSYETFNSTVSQDVFANPMSNGMSITTGLNTNTIDDKVKRTRIYSSGERSIVVDELSLSLKERTLSDPNSDKPNPEVPS